MEQYRFWWYDDLEQKSAQLAHNQLEGEQGALNIVKAQNDTNLTSLTKEVGSRKIPECIHINWTQTGLGTHTTSGFDHKVRQ